MTTTSYKVMYTPGHSFYRIILARRVLFVHNASHEKTKRGSRAPIHQRTYAQRASALVYVPDWDVYGLRGRSRRDRPIRFSP